MQSLFFFLVALALLIVIHEFGHFWVARRCGVKVLRFSIGFGTPIWRRLGRDGTEYVVGPIPLGGYVKMLDEREVPVDEAELGQAFNRQPLGKRAAIVAAGPAANILFAIFTYWLVFVIGIPGIKPYIEQVDPASVAYETGLVAGDEILKIAQQPTPTWEAVVRALLPIAERGGQVAIMVNSGGTVLSHRLLVPQRDTDKNGSLLKQIGITPLIPELEPVLGKIVDGQAASKAGIRSGDRLISANGESIDTWNGWVEFIQSHPGQTIEMVIERDGRRMQTTLTLEQGDDGLGRIGAAVDIAATEIPIALQGVLRYSPLPAMKAAAMETWRFSSSTLASLWGMLVGTVSIDNLGGPISIAQIASSSAQQGLVSFIGFLAMISVTLGILNLLPIPILDGGHLAMFFIEWLRGKPLAEETQIKGQRLGLILLLMLMFLAFFNDLTRLFG